MKMKKKTVLYVLALVISLLLTASFINSRLNKDQEVKIITNELDILTQQVIEAIGDPPTFEGAKKAQVILDSNKGNLVSHLYELNKNGEARMDTSSEAGLQKCYENNSQKMKDLYIGVLKKIEDDMGRLNDAKERFNKDNSQANLDEMNKELSSFQDDKQLQRAVNGLFASYALIFNQDTRNHKEEEEKNHGKI